MKRFYLPIEKLLKLFMSGAVATMGDGPLEVFNSKLHPIVHHLN